MVHSQATATMNNLSLICHREDYQTLKLKEPLKTHVIPLLHRLKNQGPGGVSMAFAQTNTAHHWHSRARS